MIAAACVASDSNLDGSYWCPMSRYVESDNRRGDRSIIGTKPGKLYGSLRKTTMMARFKDGDRVHHIGRKEDGTVTVGRNGEIEVLFDQPAPSGKPSIGIFDNNWFAMYPNWLQPAGPKLPDRHYKSDFKPH